MINDVEGKLRKGIELLREYVYRNGHSQYMYHNCQQWNEEQCPEDSGLSIREWVDEPFYKASKVNRDIESNQSKPAGLEEKLAERIIEHNENEAVLNASDYKLGFNDGLESGKSKWRDIKTAPIAEFILVGYNVLDYVAYAWFDSGGKGTWRNANDDIIKTPDAWMPLPVYNNHNYI